MKSADVQLLKVPELDQIHLNLKPRLLDSLYSLAVVHHHMLLHSGALLLLLQRLLVAHLILPLSMVLALRLRVPEGRKESILVKTRS